MLKSFEHETEKKIHRYSIKEIIFGSMTAVQWKMYCSVNVNKTFVKGPDTDNTPYDKRLGATENDVICPTCFEKVSKDTEKDRSCEGHFGYIELVEPIINPQYMDYVFKLLRCVCDRCSKILLPADDLYILLNKSPYLRQTYIYNKKKTICPHCSSSKDPHPVPDYSLSKDKTKILELYSGSETLAPSYVPVNRILNIFKGISNEDLIYLGLNTNLMDGHKFINPIYTTSELTHVHQIRPENWIFEVLPVVPTRSLPYVEDPKTHERKPDIITTLYSNIIELNDDLRRDRDRTENINYETTTKQFIKSLKKKSGVLTDVERTSKIVTMTNKISEIINNSKNKNKKAQEQHRTGLLDRLKGKQGHVQSYVVGKRCDFSSRSVVDAGPMLEIDELGVPAYLAKNLTMPILVNDYNINDLQTLIEEGKVSQVIRADKECFQLKDRVTPYILRPGDTIRRYLIDGDIVLFNRQPSIRKESIMGFRVKILYHDLCYRISLGVTTPFNADFDGDEMNLSAIQMTKGIAESITLAHVNTQIRTPQSCNNVIGCVQDARIAVYLLTNTWSNEVSPNTILKWEVMADCFVSIKTKETWSNFLKRVSKYYPDYVVIDERGNYKANRVLEGVPGKLALSCVFSQNVNYSWGEFNPKTQKWSIEIRDGVILPHSKVLTSKNVGGSSRSVIDIVWCELSSYESASIISKIQFFTDRWLPNYGFSVSVEDCYDTNKYTKSEVLGALQKNISEMKQEYLNKSNYERDMIQRTNIISNMENKIKNSMTKGQKNAFIVMNSSGAKGSLTNLTHITTVLGQQVVFGQRPPPKLSCNTRTLPHFEINENSIVARGFITSSYITGLQPWEVFFHSMAGREGLIKTSHDTPDTGYIEKQIGKKIEDNTIHWDSTVRDRLGGIVQFIYGGDGYSAQHLYKTQKNKIKFIDLYSVAENLNAQSENQKINLSDDMINLILSVIFVGCRGIQSIPCTIATNRLRKELADDLKNILIAEDKIGDFGAKIMKMHYRAKSHDGDMVGLIATLSISSNATQTTLNAHRLVGQISNTTGGLERIKEIIYTLKSESQKTPYITIYPKNEVIYKNNNTINDLMNINQTLQQDSDEYKQNINYIAEIREQNMDILEKLRSRFASTYVTSFVKDYDMFYIPVKTDTNVRPPEITEYYKHINIFEEYQKPWWVSMYSKLKGIINIPEKYWVYALNINIEILYRYGFSLETLCDAIENSTVGRDDKIRLVAIPSPLHISQIHIFIDYSSSTSINNLLIEKDNYEIIIFKYTRDNIKKFIMSSMINGIEGIAEAEVIEKKNIDGSEAWVLQTVAEKKPDGKVKVTDAYKQILSRDDVFFERTTFSDFKKIEEIFGIESARKCVLDELKIHIGNDVNTRHVELLVDGLCYKGNLSAAATYGLSKEVLGPCSVNSYQENDKNFCSSAVYTERDNLKGIIGSIMNATKPNFGTGRAKVLENFFG